MRAQDLEKPSLKGVGIRGRAELRGTLVRARIYVTVVARRLTWLFWLKPVLSLILGVRSYTTPIIAQQIQTSLDFEIRENGHHFVKTHLKSRQKCSDFE